MPLIVGGAVFAGELGGGGGGGGVGDENGGGELIGVNGGDRVVGGVPTVTGDDGAVGFLTLTHRRTRV